MTKTNNDNGFVSIGDAIQKYDKEEEKYVSREFQQYGYDLAEELGDLKRKSLYIKLAKETPRGLLESARSFVKDAENVKNKAALFMWRLKQLKTAKDDTQEERKR